MVELLVAIGSPLLLDLFNGNTFSLSPFSFSLWLNLIHKPSSFPQGEYLFF